MRFFFFVSLILIVSCSKSVELEMPCKEEGCGYMNPIGFGIDALENSALLHFGSSGHIDGPFLSCPPEAFDIYMSIDGDEFVKLIRIEQASGSHLVEDLENGQEVTFKVVALHCELDSVIAPLRSLVIGEILLPEFSPTGTGFEDFRLSPDGDQFIHRTSWNTWRPSKISTLQDGNIIIEEAYNAAFNPNYSSEICFIQQTRVNITGSVEGIVDKALMTLDLNTGAEQVLHEVDHLHDFDFSTHSPEQYWLNSFRYSLDGKSIYVSTNKDNGSSTDQEKRVYNNIWKLDLSSGALEMITDFLPIEFDMDDFIEDPKSHGNFYMIGGTYGEEVEGQGGSSNTDRVDIHYYDSFSQTVNPIFISDYEEKYIDIDPQGNNLVFSSDRTGRFDLWKFNLATQKVGQLTDSSLYISYRKWQYINWISDDEFMTGVRHEDELKFAVFKL